MLIIESKISYLEMEDSELNVF